MIYRNVRTCVVLLFACTVTGLLSAAAPRVLPPGNLPADRRLQPLKDLNGYFPFTPPGSLEQWQQRVEQVRRRLLVSQGLWPMPTKHPLNAVIHGKIDQGDYTVEKAYFESLPGFYVTGNLYRPKGSAGKRPAVLSPHGHWPNGRFYDAGQDAVRRLIVTGAERFEDSGRSHLQARCVELARLGCVVFHYDMIGYVDSQQISLQIAHGFAKQRPEMNRAEGWGLFSPQAEAHLQSIMGLQTYSSIRAIDFVSQLPDVDPERIAVTGASGGGTQTFMVSAVDERVAVSVPAVMVSTAMQGGCTCENACLLRVGTGNVEFAALFAPKPQSLLAADDWTHEMATKGFPQLKALYKQLGAERNVELNANIQFPHNYNNVSRAAMYHWLNRHFKLGHETPIVEGDFPRLTAEELTVWDESHPRPSGGVEFERQLMKLWAADSRRQLDEARPTDRQSLRQYKELVGGAIDVLIGRGLPAAEDVKFEHLTKIDEADYLTIGGVLRNQPHGEELPIAFLHPKEWSGRVVIWLSPQGKAGLFDQDGQPHVAIQRLLKAGASVVGVDLLYQGEFLADGKAIDKTRRVENPREAAAYSFGYNHTLCAQRVQDVLSVITYVRSHELTPKEVYLVGLRGAGHWAAAARAQARGAVDKVAIDTAGFRFGAVNDIHSPDFLPGGAKYDDLDGMLAVASPDPLWLAGEGASLPAATDAAYQAAGAKAAAVVFRGQQNQTAMAAVDWLLD